MPTLGETLREARTQKKARLAQVEAETRIPKDKLEALEGDDLAALPDDVYTKGAIRNYALYLDLNPDELWTLYRTARPAAVTKGIFERDLPATRQRLTPVAYATIAAIIVILIIVALFATHVI